MQNGKNGRVTPCVLIDMNTQFDFFGGEGACPVVNHLEKHACLRRIVAWAKRNQVPIISSMDSHRRIEHSTNGRPKHCIEGSVGQRKLPFTVFPNHVFVAGDNTLSVSTDLFQKHQQVIFPQRDTDLFTNPKADRFLTQLDADEFILFGAVAEHEIKAVALGLLVRNKRVTVLADGCGFWNLPEFDLALRQVKAKGARVISICELRERKLPKVWKYTKTSRIGISPLNAGTPLFDHSGAASARKWM